MKALKILGIILVVVVLLLVGGVLYLNHYLQTPEFKQKVLTAARDAVGSDVKISDINVSLTGGVALRGIVIANPTGFAGELLTAEAFVLRPRLLPLLSKRIEIKTLRIVKPVITLARNENAEWNYEKLGSTTGNAAPSAAAPGSSKITTGGLDIMLSKVVLKQGEITMLSEKNKPLLHIQDVNFQSSVNLSGTSLNGRGQASIEVVDVAGSLFVRQFSVPVQFQGHEVTLNPLEGRLADGTLSGDVRLKLQPGFSYGLNLSLKDADLDKLLQEAGAKRVMSGKLQIDANLQGTGGLPTMTGAGKAEIVGGTLVQVPVQNTLATLLQVPALREIKFDQCIVEFTLANNVMQTPTIILKSPLVQVTGNGSISLADNTLNHNMTLALAKETLNNVPAEIRKVFAERPDGFLTLDFRVWGPYDSPQTDLKDRIVRGATQQLIDKGLQKLFK
jgi:uncharacterized protein YhdP